MAKRETDTSETMHALERTIVNQVKTEIKAVVKVIEARKRDIETISQADEIGAATA